MPRLTSQKPVCGSRHTFYGYPAAVRPSLLHERLPRDLMNLFCASMRYFGLLAPRARNRTSAAVFALVGQDKCPRPRRLSWQASLRKYFGVDTFIDNHGQSMHWLSWAEIRLKMRVP